MPVIDTLMRHAQIPTTMNVYGNALMAAKRAANSKVIRMALGAHSSEKGSCSKNPGPPRASWRALLYGVIWGWPIG
jgi:hypothetical protein